MDERSFGLFIVIVGVHVSAVPEETFELDPGSTRLRSANTIDHGGTGRDCLRKGREAIRSRRHPGPGISHSGGEIVKNAARPYIEDLDAIPLVSAVYKRHLDISPLFLRASRYPLIVIVTGRGCPFHCTYCVIPQTLMGHRYRKRSITSIIKEFRYIAENFPDVREIMIEDDTLTADRKRCMEFANALIAAGATRIPWSANSRADVDYETLRAMKRAGCRLVCVGFESGDQQILDNIRKSLSLENIKEFVRNAKRAGIMVHGCFMVGNRGETAETLEKTLALAKELSPDTAQFFPIMVYPGTADYTYFGERGWITTRISENGLPPMAFIRRSFRDPNLPMSPWSPSAIARGGSFISAPDTSLQRGARRSGIRPRRNGCLRADAPLSSIFSGRRSPPRHYPARTMVRPDDNGRPARAQKRLPHHAGTLIHRERHFSGRYLPKQPRKGGEHATDRLSFHYRTGAQAD